MDETTTVNLATRKRRLFAFLIDSLIIALFGKLLGLLLGDFFIELGNLGKIVGFIVVLFYFGIGNSKILNGQTVAKKLLSVCATRHSAKQAVPGPRHVPQSFRCTHRSTGHLYNTRLKARVHNSKVPYPETANADAA